MTTKEAAAKRDVLNISAIMMMVIEGCSLRELQHDKQAMSDMVQSVPLYRDTDLVKLLINNAVRFESLVRSGLTAQQAAFYLLRNHGDVLTRYQGYASRKELH